MAAPPNSRGPARVDAFESVHSPTTTLASLIQTTTPENQVDSIRACVPIQGVEVPESSERQALTTFVDEACEEVDVRGAHYLKLNSFPTNGYADDVKAYFARPFKYRVGTFGAQASLMTPAVCFSDAYYPGLSGYPGVARLAGAFGVRFTMVWRLEVAVTPFTGGLIKLTWVPFQTTRFDVYQPTVSFHSMAPGVRMDLCEQTSVVLRVPWIGPYDFMPLYNTTALSTESIGALTLASLLPISSGTGVPAPAWTLWHSLEDVEVVGATAISLVPQSGGPSGESASKSMAIVSRAVSFIGKSIPSLSSVATPVSWALSLSSGAAAAFGYSKPINCAVPKVIENVYTTNQTNVDGQDTTRSVAGSYLNAVSILPGFAGSDVDEMSLAYLLSRPCMIGAFTFTVGDSAIKLFSVSTAPAYMWQQSATRLTTKDLSYTSNGSFHPSPVFYFANCFDLWRGSFEFIITANKTKFHSGRLLLRFSPSYFGDPRVPGPDDDQLPLNGITAVWDLRQGNVFKMHCPWICPVAYLPTSVCTGTLDITALEYLVAPSTVCQVISFMVEVRCASDFELAAPREPLYQRAPLDASPVFAQSGGPSEHAIGERVTSIKQLIQRASPISYTITSLDSLRPWYIPHTDPGFATYVNFSEPASYYLTRPFLLARGSTCYDVYAPFTRFWKAYRTTVNLVYSSANVISGVIFADKFNHLRLPFYSQTTRALVANDIHSQSRLTISPSAVSSYAYGIDVFIRAADDAQLGYFLAVPPLGYPVGGFGGPGGPPGFAPPQILSPPPPLLAPGVGLTQLGVEPSPVEPLQTFTAPTSDGALVSMPIPVPPPSPRFRRPSLSVTSSLLDK